LALGGLGRGRGAHSRARVPGRAIRGAVGRGASAGPGARAGPVAGPRAVTVQPVLPLPPVLRPTERWPRAHEQPLARRARVQPVVRWALYAYICSIPFEMPGRSIPVEIPTLVGSVFLLATLLDRRAAYGRLPQALVAFVVYLWMFATAALLNLASHQLEVLHFFVEMVQLLLLFWTIANLLTDEPVRLGALRALALACAVRAALQVFGLASTQRALWTGGERISALGQNANLSALILATGLLATLVLPSVRDPTRRSPLVVRGPLVALIAAAIIQTSSRGGLLAVAAGLMTFLGRGPTPWIRLRNAGAAVCVLGLLGLASFRSEAM